MIASSQRLILTASLPEFSSCYAPAQVPQFKQRVVTTPVISNRSSFIRVRFVLSLT
jgi:hypothetical protein